MPLELTAIVAMADNNRGIGLRNHLPWSVPEDWNYFLDFVRTTRDPSKVNALLMGRKTFESVPEMGLGTSLSPCLNVVITSRFGILFCVFYMTLTQWGRCNENQNSLYYYYCYYYYIYSINQIQIHLFHK